MPFRTFARVAALSAAVWASAAHAGDAYDTSRIVSIGGSLTEIVYALGEEARLVARDTTSVYPEAALALPDVGYIRALSPEGVLSVDPTLILTLEGSGPPDAIEVLRKASVPVVDVPETFDREGILEKIRIVGEVLGVEDKASELARQADADIRAAEAATAGIDDREKVLFVLALQDGRILASGTGTAADGIIGMAGGINAVTGYHGYKQVSDEAVITAAPDIVLVMDRGGDHQTRAAELLAQPAIAQTPAGRDGRIVSVDGARLLGFGPRTGSAIRELSAALYGDPDGAD